MNECAPIAHERDRLARGDVQVEPGQHDGPRAALPVLAAATAMVGTSVPEVAISS